MTDPIGQRVPPAAAARMKRFLIVARMVAQVYGGYKVVQALSKVIAAERSDAMYHRHHRRSAQLAYRTATRLEGLLIKACQFLGTRADILPDEYITVLSQLH